MDEHPFSVIVSVKVNEVPFAIAPAVTSTDDPVLPEVIIPFPVIDQRWVAPLVADEEYDRPVVPSQTGVRPEIVQLGFGLTVTSAEAVALVLKPPIVAVAVTVL